MVVGARVVGFIGVERGAMPAQYVKKSKSGVTQKC